MRFHYPGASLKSPQSIKKLKADRPHHSLKRGVRLNRVFARRGSTVFVESRLLI